MSIRRSPCKTSLSALHRTVLTRRPIVSAAYFLGSYMHHRQMSASRRPVTSRRTDMAVAFITVIDATHNIPFVQIPIAHRRR
jgi:hypothetical protein